MMHVLYEYTHKKEGNIMRYTLQRLLDFIEKLLAFLAAQLVLKSL